VGLLSIEIFGYRNPACRQYAIALGRALQLTNILRDVGSDAQRQRIYLPLEELERFHVTPDEILQRRTPTVSVPSPPASLTAHATGTAPPAKPCRPMIAAR
jgi:phytoene/squalene synthetase